MKTLNDLKGTQWAGKGELWLDPLGNTADHSECTIAIDDEGISYTWSYKGDTHRGSLKPSDGGADFTDSWHSPQAMRCNDVPGSWGLLNVQGSYSAGEGPDWGWRISLCVRAPTGELVLQMTNIAPWGEEGRAVRMVCARG